ncbi:hypothetical protein [Burkholderia anthina]|uniref:hypothetical protein n=1 Tax=Burkholderia anthina TaxID=179879 RepID=UPI0037BE6DFF
MHPTAALLALHGCQCYRLRHGTLRAAMPRAPEKNLLVLFYNPARGGWELNRVFIPHTYMRCDWIEIPDKKWDVIRPELLHRFIESITA